jgi:hypothetical protein
MTITNQRRIGGSDQLTVSYERYERSGLLASLMGMFAGLGTIVFLSALLAAGVAIFDFRLDIINDVSGFDETSILSLVVAAVIVFASLVVGGYAAGRIARYNGGISGMGAGLWLVFLGAIFAVLGAWVGASTDAFDRFDLPDRLAQVDATNLTAAAVIASAVLVVAALLGGYMGGRIGETLVAVTRKDEDTSEVEDVDEDTSEVEDVDEDTSEVED